MAGHIVKHRPGHDLEKITVDRIAHCSGNTNREWGAWVSSCFDLCQLLCCADWMDVIEISALIHDLLKLFKRVAPFRLPRVVRRQVAGNDVWTCITEGPGGSADGPEVHAPAQVDTRIDHGLLAKVGVSASGVIEVWRTTRGVAAVAIRLSVDNEAAQSYQISLFFIELYGNRGD